MTAAEFKLFMNFLKSLSLFGQNAPVERIQELVEIIEGQTDLDAQFDVCSVDQITVYLLFISSLLVADSSKAFYLRHGLPYYTYDLLCFSVTNGTPYQSCIILF